MIKNTIEGNPQFENADYYFNNQNVIIELKSLQSDFAEINQLSPKVEKQLMKWLEKGELNFPALFNLSLLTNWQKRKIFQIKYEPIRRTLKKANSQIKSTKKFSKNIEAHGIAILIIDGVESVEFNELFEAICFLLYKEEFSCIDGFVLMTMNTYIDIGNQIANQVWAPAYKQENNTHLANFVNYLGKEWGEFFQLKTGKFENEVIQADDYNILKNTTHVR
ncbi:hypothetical protein GFH30_06625 [Acinetobacter wanghuae]|uniref:Uncharacterized protein n=1 Tax=Acinetobacter wanghuae TaxID=2662362 RepID=A0A5Q0P3B0_9GAMM|nr:hypothetical protein [Acinetobacter wanghuae]MQW92578.1 hypothetical protein [Acinetobacter wanghuae]QGA11082.1 hypothetical protein GFH30_06625 [Acinetobacter wanghuae]